MNIWTGRHDALKGISTAGAVASVEWIIVRQRHRETATETNMTEKHDRDRH